MLQKSLQELTHGIVSIYGDLADQIILYGSYARGTETEESDVDIAVILREGATQSMYDQLLDLVVDLELKCDWVLSVTRIQYDRYMHWKQILPFYQNIQKEGVILWKAAS